MENKIETPEKSSSEAACRYPSRVNRQAHALSLTGSGFQQAGGHPESNEVAALSNGCRTLETRSEVPAFIPWGLISGQVQIVAEITKVYGGLGEAGTGVWGLGVRAWVSDRWNDGTLERFNVIAGLVGSLCPA